MNDDLDPRLIAALRDLAPADDDIRDLHISTALAELRVSGRRPLMRSVSVAAALILLLGGVAAFRPGQSPRDSGVSAAEHTPISLPSKTGTDVPVTNVDPGTTSECRSTLDGSLQVGEYGPGHARFRVDLNSESMEVLDPRTCVSIAIFDLPVLPRSQSVCIPSLTSGTELVGSYSTATTNVIVLATETELTILGGPRCEVIARFPQPPTK